MPVLRKVTRFIFDINFVPIIKAISKET